MDKELEKFNADMLESIQQMKRGQAQQVHSPEQIKARRGRPPGSVMAVTTPMASPNSPTCGHPKFPQARPFGL